MDFEDRDNELSSLIDGHLYKPFDEDRIFKELKKAFSKNKKAKT